MSGPFKLPGNADGRNRTRPLGHAERPEIRVNDYRRTTSMSAILALITDLSECQRRRELICRFPNSSQFLVTFIGPERGMGLRQN